MLVLARKVGEAIYVGDALVRVLRLQNGQIKLGIEASQDVKVLREELRERPHAPIKRNRSA